uniref:Conotoxin Superfamily S n=1 Tax=Conus episcopatus TaxID=88764 RepID=A0A0K2S6T8_CONEP|nr:Conotoxin Superfamily S [Conus episcopatus]
MMSKLGAMFVLLLLFTLASSQEKGDVQAGKTQKSDFYRTLTRSARGCTMSCAFQNNICQGTCHGKQRKKKPLPHLTYYHR